MNILTGFKKGWSLEKLAERKVRAVAVNSDGFSSSDGGIDLEETLKECHHFGMELWVRLDCLYEEREMTALGEYLKRLDDLGADGIMFTDLAVNELAMENGLSLKRMYTPETLLTNSYDVAELEREMDYCVISQDITLHDIREIIDASKERCCLRIHGPILLSYSRRMFISAYLKTDREVYDDGYYVIEETRSNKMPLIQTARGCWLYGNSLQSLSEIEMIDRSPLAYVIVDNNLTDEKYNLSVIDLYNGILAGSITVAEAVKRLESLDERIGYTDLSSVQESWLDKVSR